jgi:hypothetical protein
MKVFNYIIVMLFSVTAFSQIVSPNGNNLFYYNGLADVTFRFSERGSGGRAFVHAPGNVFAINYEEDFNGGTRIGRDVYFKDGGNSFISSGNFGIGTSQPTSILSVGITHGVKLSIGNPLWANLSIIETGYTYQVGDFTEVKVPGYGVNNAYMRITQSGNVGIGTIEPKNKLDVNGTIHSKEVKVDMNGWSDFVFKKEYNLPTLEEVEKYIADKGHLENIPSEKEVLQNGINLGEMNAKLLQKIEELTLYMIEMKKENEEQSRKINTIELKLISKK